MTIKQIGLAALLGMGLTASGFGGEQERIITEKKVGLLKSRT